MNLILNGSFETGDFTNWVGSGTTDVHNSIESGVDISGNVFKIGNPLLIFALGPTPAYTFQFALGLNPELEYELSYRLKSDGSGEGVSFKLWIDGYLSIPELTIDSTFPAFPWTLFKYRFTNKTFCGFYFATTQIPGFFFQLTQIKLSVYTPPPRMFMSLYSNNTVYYKPHTVSSGIGSVTNYRKKYKKT